MLPAFHHLPGRSTTLITPSSLSRNFLYISGASSRLAGCVTTKLGSISPASIFCEQGLGVGLNMRLPGLDGQTLVHRGAKRDLVAHADIDARNGNRARLAAAHDRLAQDVDAVGRQEMSPP